jgi:hypothetical protein
MNQKIELSPRQLEALTAAFKKKAGISVLGLMKELQCETALAKSLIRQLMDIEYLTDYGNGNHGVSREGRDALIAAGVPGAERKQTGRTAEENDYVDPYDMPPAYTKPKLEIPPEKPDFMALVYRGLSKLNAQLGMQPAIIENKFIKIEALNKLADTLSGFDQALPELLRSVALDLERLGGEK